MENSTQEVYLQWIKGDKVGNVELVTSHDKSWTIFKSGARIANDLIHEFMIPVEGEPLDLNTIDLPHTIDPVPHTIVSSSAQAVPIHNPIKTLFDKQKKMDHLDLHLSFSIKVPAKNIFEIISMSFDEDEVNAELNSFISAQISSEMIKDTLLISIEELIKDRYSKVNF